MLTSQHGTIERDEAHEHPDDQREAAACMRLWRAVMQQAMRDLNTRFASRKARRWFDSDSEGPGRLRWICETVGLDPEEVRSKAGKVTR